MKRFNHLLFKNWGYWVILIVKYNFFWTIKRYTCFMLLPEFPYNFSIDNILLSWFKIYFKRCTIRILILKWINILPILTYFHQYNSNRWIIVLLNLFSHKSLISLIQWNNIFSTLSGFYLYIIRLVIFVAHS